MLKTITKQGMKLLSKSALLAPALVIGAFAPTQLHAVTQTLTLTTSDFSSASTKYAENKCTVDGFSFKGFFKVNAGNFELPTMKQSFVANGPGYITVTEAPENVTIKSVEVCYPTTAYAGEYYRHNIYRFSDQSSLSVSTSAGLTSVSKLTPVANNIEPVPGGSNTATINDKYFLIGIIGTRYASYQISSIVVTYEIGDDVPQTVNLEYEKTIYEITEGETLPFPVPTNGTLTDAQYSVVTSGIISEETDGFKALTYGETTVNVSGKVNGQDAIGSFTVKVNAKETEDGYLPLTISSNDGNTSVNPGSNMAITITTPDGKLADFEYEFSPKVDKSDLRFNTAGTFRGIITSSSCPPGEYVLTVTGQGYGTNAAKYKGSFEFTVIDKSTTNNKMSFPNAPYNLKKGDVIDLPSGWFNGTEIPASALKYSAATQDVVNIANGQLTASGSGSTKIEVEGEYNGENYYGTFSVNIEAGIQKKAPTITLPLTGKTDHIRNAGYVNGEHGYSEYTFYADNASGFYPSEMTPAIEVEMAVDEDWYAKYGWNQDYLETLEGDAAEEYHRVYHLSYPGTPHAEFENNSILHLHANIPGVYNIRFKFPESDNYLGAEHTMQLTIVPDLYQYVYLQDIGINAQSGSHELVEGKDYSKVEIFTSYIGELFYNITYKTASPANPVAYLATAASETPAGMTKYKGRVNLNNAESIELATRVNGQLSQTRKINFVTVDTPTGVDGVDAAAAEAEYFTLQGLKVSLPLEPGIYVKVVDGKASKVLVK